MGRPRKQIVEQIQQQADEINDQSADEAAATIQEIATEALEIVASEDALTLLNELYEFCILVPTHCELDRGAWVRQQLLSRIDQIKAAL